MAERKTLLHKIAAIEQKVDSLSDKTDRIGSTLEYHMRDVEKRLTNVESGLKEVNKRLTNVESDVKEGNKRLTNVESDVKEGNKRLTNVESDMKEVKKRLKTLEIDVSAIKRDVVLIPQMMQMLELSLKTCVNDDVIRTHSELLGEFGRDLLVVKTAVKSLNK